MENWETKISGHNDKGELEIRGQKLEDLIKEKSFVQVIFLLLTAREATENEEKMLNAIFVASIDHGVDAPSTTIARMTASTGVPLSTAVANGVAAIGERHGGAAEACAILLSENILKDTKEIVQEFKDKSKRLPGFGHKIYEVDPRTQVLVQIAESNGFKGKFVNKALEIEKELENSSGKKLPLNIDGITAALMLEMGFDPALGKGLFIISRIAGLVAHVQEENQRGKLRRLDEGEVKYSN